MIVSSIPLNIQRFINHLNDAQYVSVPCLIVYLPYHACVLANEEEDCEETAFAMYSIKRKVMYVAGHTIELFKDEEDAEALAERMIMENIAHEYVHHIQNCRGEFSKEEVDSTLLEVEAENMAVKLVNNYLEDYMSECKYKEFEEDGKIYCDYYEKYIITMEDCCSCRKFCEDGDY